MVQSEDSSKSASVRREFTPLFSADVILYVSTVEEKRCNTGLPLPQWSDYREYSLLYKVQMHDFTRHKSNELICMLQFQFLCLILQNIKIYSDIVIRMTLFFLKNSLGEIS